MVELESKLREYLDIVSARVRALVEIVRKEPEHVSPENHLPPPEERVELTITPEILGNIASTGVFDILYPEGKEPDEPKKSDEEETTQP